LKGKNAKREAVGRKRQERVMHEINSWKERNASLGSKRIEGMHCKLKRRREEEGK
jgi:hypothetical protein